MDRGEIQVVRRLIQQQQVGLHQEQTSQLGAHTPTTAELAHDAVHVLLHEADAFQHPFDLHIVVGRADRVQALVGMGQQRCQFHRLFVGRCFLQVLLDTLQRCVEGDRLLERLLCHLPRCEGEVVGHLLGEITHRELLRLADRALVVRLLAGHDLQQGAFPRPVAAYQSDAILATNEERDIVEHRPLTEV